jgi:hypothetical protein
LSAAPASWYAIIDGAQDSRLLDLVRTCAQHICLFKGEMAPEVAQAAPWLVRIDEREPLLGTWRQHGDGLSWGVTLLSEHSLEALQRHLRRFLQARLPDGTLALFRFYDPRVFNTYIRAVTAQERAPWFDGVTQYAAERADAAGVHQYWLNGGRLFDGDQAIG